MRNSVPDTVKMAPRPAIAIVACKNDTVVLPRYKFSKPVAEAAPTPPVRGRGSPLCYGFAELVQLKRLREDTRRAAKF